jgi:2-polyprenyl-3-methyl-5-hydroxy-6-metoxy-1,4-benzoquinol methylase
LNCILCKKEYLVLETEIPSEIIKNLWRRDLQFDINDEIGTIKSFKLFKCCSCNVKFFYPSLSGSNKLYKYLEKFDWYYMPEKWEHKVALKDLIKSEIILEIGSGFGDFLNTVILEKGNVIEGIELNETAVIESQRRGLPVKAIDLQEIVQEFPGHYDAVCSFQVLEHVPNPKEFLDNMCNLLKPGGKLIMGLPNANSFLKHQFNILDMPPHHMTRWSQSTLEKLPELFPIQLNHIKFEPLADYHVNGYVGAYLSKFAKVLKLNFINKPRLIQLISKILILTKMNKLLKGQSIYASYSRK